MVGTPIALRSATIRAGSKRASRAVARSTQRRLITIPAHVACRLANVLRPCGVHRRSQALRFRPRADPTRNLKIAIHPLDLADRSAAGAAPDRISDRWRRHQVHRASGLRVQRRPVRCEGRPYGVRARHSPARIRVRRAYIVSAGPQRRASGTQSVARAAMGTQSVARLPCRCINYGARIFSPCEAAIQSPSCLTWSPRFMNDNSWKSRNLCASRDKHMYLLGLRRKGSEAG